MNFRNRYLIQEEDVSRTTPPAGPLGNINDVIDSGNNAGENVTNSEVEKVNDPGKPISQQGIKKDSGLLDNKFSLKKDTPSSTQNDLAKLQRIVNRTQPNL